MHSFLVGNVYCKKTPYRHSLMCITVTKTPCRQSFLLGKTCALLEKPLCRHSFVINVYHCYKKTPCRRCIPWRKPTLLGKTSLYRLTLQGEFKD
jgi:hypothetical protein